MTGALTLEDFPHDYVELACSKCERRGRLSRERLIAEHGRDVRLPDLLRQIADCPRMGRWDDHCGVYYVALKP